MLSTRNIILTVVSVAALLVVGDMIRNRSGIKPRHAPSKAASKPTVQQLSAPKTAMPAGTPYWQANHETGNLEEYSWWHPQMSSNGSFDVVPDPTASGHGYVYRGEVTSATPKGGDSHRLYPVLLLPECYRGSYSSTFSVWADIPPKVERGWFSFATYTNRGNWQDLFGVNLGHEQGEDRLILFHVPVVGKGDFTRISSIPFPLRQWVKVEVRVDKGGIMLFQDERLVAEAKKLWGAEGPGLCEAHWGMYAQDYNRRGLFLNDDISVTLDAPFDKPPRKVRETGGKR